MARFIKTFECGEATECVCDAAVQYLSDKGYIPKDYEYEDVYTKGSGLIKNPSYYKIIVSGNRVTFEIWKKTAFSLGVFFNEKLPSKSVMREFEELVNIIMSLGAAPCLENEQQSIKEKLPLLDCNARKRVFLKKHLAPSLKKEMIYSNVVAGVLCLVSVFLSVVGAGLSFGLLVFIAPIVLGFITIMTNSTGCFNAAAIVNAVCAGSCLFTNIDNVMASDYAYTQPELVAIYMTVSVFITLLGVMFGLTAASMWITNGKINGYFKKATKNSAQN